ncbi:alkaline phosphatase family protein [Terriglobus sp. YAF25]|uniref:alkaline phosphatase family protein n=1 Tax=Terriglobus sp. YAF25 TaxID=3233080 RepID=UPI003F991273
MSTPDNTADSSLAKTRSNVVTINDLSNAISSISYVSGSLVITDGQPSQTPPTISFSDGTFTITLEAGREKSTPVADAFNSNCGNDSAKEYAPFGGGETPEELNFMFAVVIQFSIGAAVTVYLGQGHAAARNNWWIGGSAIFSLDTPRLECSINNLVYTYELSGSHDSFDLQFKDTRPVSAIQNVFVLMLENHSFDNMLALSGIPGIYAATTSDSNSYNGTPYNVQGNPPLNMPTDPGHEFDDVLEQLAGPGSTYVSGQAYPTIYNSGFVANYATTTTEGPVAPAADICDIMKCFDTKDQLPALYQLATEYVVCDQWFSSLPGPTWPNRFFLHAASSSGLDHTPSGGEIFDWVFKDFSNGFKFSNGSIFDEMTAKGITWGLYHDTNGPIGGRVPLVAAIEGIYVADVNDLETFESDVTSSDYPYQYTFIEPNYGDALNGTYENGSSQHPMDSVANGEALPLTGRDAAANVIQGVQTANVLRTDCPVKLKPPAPRPEKRPLLTAEEQAALDLEPIPDRSNLMGFLGILFKEDVHLAATPQERAAAAARFQGLKTRGDARVYMNEIMAKVQVEKARRAAIAVPA